MLQSKQLTGGLTMFFFQYLVQAGFFFVVPLYLSVCLGLSALATGVAAAAALDHPAGRGDRDPALLPAGLAAASSSAAACSRCSPGRSSCSARSTRTPGPEVVFLPMLLVGLGIGALASQLGAVTVSAVPDDQAPEVGGVQNTMTNLGASIGTALAGSILIASLSSAFLTNIEASSAIPSRVKSEANVQLAGGVPFISDDDLQQALDGRPRRLAGERRGDRRLPGRPDQRAARRRSRSSARWRSSRSSSRGRIPTKQPGST